MRLKCSLPPLRPRSHLAILFTCLKPDFIISLSPRAYDFSILRAELHDLAGEIWSAFIYGALYAGFLIGFSFIFCAHFQRSLPLFAACADSGLAISLHARAEGQYAATASLLDDAFSASMAFRVIRGRAATSLSLRDAAARDARSNTFIQFRAAQAQQCAALSSAHYSLRWP